MHSLGADIEFDDVDNKTFDFNLKMVTSEKVVKTGTQIFVEALLYKRIKYGKFHFPTVIDSDKYTVTNEELNWLLHGLQIENIHKYERLKNERVSTNNKPFQHGIMY